jgi:hypothetical protein
MLRGMIVESVQLGSGLAGGERVVVDRSRVLAEHGVERAEEMRQFDEFVLRVGGSLRRARGIRGGFVWDLPRSVLYATPGRATQADPLDCGARPSRASNG